MPLLCLLCLLAWQSPAQEAPAVVPFEIINSKHMAVNIKVNGRGPYRVIFDTGAPISLLSGRIAKEANLVKGKESVPPLFGMQGFFKVPEMSLGDLHAKNIQVVVMDHPTVKAISEVVGPIDGILGFPFFSKFRTAINYHDKTLTMSPTSYDPGDIMQSLMATMMSGGKERKIPLAPGTLWGLAIGKEPSDEENGVEIVHVYPGSLAENAGLKVGDRLITLDGWWTDSLEDAYRAATLVKAGRTVKLTYRRQGGEKTIQVTPAKGL